MITLPPLAQDQCLVVFVPHDRRGYSLEDMCMCDREPGHKGRHHCPICNVAWTITSKKRHQTNPLQED